MPTAVGLGRQMLAKAGEAGTMEGCGVLFQPMGRRGEGYQRRMSWVDTCDEDDD